MAGHNAARTPISIIICAALVFLFQGCVFRPLSRTGEQNAAPFLPATPAQPTATSRSTQVQGTSQPTPTAPCQDNLAFVSDLTIPDGTEIQPGSVLDKRWEVENNGSCNWGRGYTFRLTAGDDLGAQDQIDLYPARAGTRASLQVFFEAPSEPGEYRSAWQAYNAAGDPFGDPIFIEIVVVPLSTPEETAQATP